MELDYESTSKMFSDCTCNYYVTNYDGKEYTLGEVIDYILSKKPAEFGYIYCDNYRLEYKEGKIIKGTRDKEFEKKIFICAYVNGGYGGMDYKMVTE